MEQITLQVEGMSCGHCVKSVEKAVMAIEGVEKVQVDLPKKQVQVDFIQVPFVIEKIKEAIEEAGYDVIA